MVLLCFPTTFHFLVVTYGSLVFWWIWNLLPENLALIRLMLPVSCHSEMLWGFNFSAIFAESTVLPFSQSKRTLLRARKSVEGFIARQDKRWQKPLKSWYCHWTCHIITIGSRISWKGTCLVNPLPLEGTFEVYDLCPLLRPVRREGPESGAQSPSAVWRLAPSKPEPPKLAGVNTVDDCRCMNIRRKFRSESSDNMERWKAEQGRGRQKRKIRRKKSRRERVRRKKMQMRERVGQSRNTVFFQWFGAPEGRKVGSLKRRVWSQLARWEMKNWTPLWREAHFQVKMYKTHQLRTTFGSWDVKKVHAVVARSTFPSQNVQSTPAPDHFWKLRCRKSARRCSAKHISKSKCTKHTSSGPLLEVEMSKKCTPLWREPHFEVKMLKTLHVRTTFGGSDVASLHYTTLHYTTLLSTTLRSTTLHYTTLQLQLHNYAPLHSSTLNYTTLHYTTLHYTTLHYTTLHYLPLHFTT